MGVAVWQGSPVAQQWCGEQGLRRLPVDLDCKYQHGRADINHRPARYAQSRRSFGFAASDLYVVNKPDQGFGRNLQDAERNLYDQSECAASHFDMRWSLDSH